MKRERGYYLLIVLITVGIFGAGLLGNTGLTTPLFAQEGGSISGITSTRNIDLSKELEKTWDYISRRHFHNYLADEMPQNSNPALCFICHGSYPHQNAKKTRSILNMHTIFMACETCHFKYDPKEMHRYGFRWYDGTTTIQASQRHYGTKYDRTSGIVLMESATTLYKITPYLNKEGKFYMINMRQNTPWAQKNLVNRDHVFTPEEQAKLKTSIHASIETKGRECGECHTVNSIMNFRQLGFDAERERDLTGLNIVGMVEKYQKFYIPDIFKQRRQYEAPVVEERAEK